jgi:hypothetical protein
MNNGLLFAYELYRARRNDWLRQVREHRLGRPEAPAREKKEAGPQARL